MNPSLRPSYHDPIEAAERIISGMPNAPEIQYAGSKAFYSPITDRIPRVSFSPAPKKFMLAADGFRSLAVYRGLLAEARTAQD